MATMFDTPLWLCQILILSLFILVVVEADHVSPRAFRGSDFVIANATVQGPSLGLAYVSNLDSNPVVQNAPVFLFARSNSHYTPCYPEGASNADGTGPNPGTSPPVGINPGENCNSPGPYKNSMFLFPFETYCLLKHLRLHSRETLPCVL
jgi:hypothetical protein